MIRQKAESIEEVVGNLMTALKFKGRNTEKLVDIVMPQE
jgi:DNA-directed RNA polymerase subunit F